MVRVAFGLCAVAMILLVTNTGRAANLESVDILGLRLGMPEPQVDAVLKRQVASANRVSRKPGSCQDLRGCDVTIMAPTVDGTLTITLVADESGPKADLVVAQVSYALNGKAMGEDAMIRSSVLERFGPPSQAVPMTWCKSVAAGRACRPDQPSLRFLPESLTLTLTAGTPGAPTK